MDVHDNRDALRGIEELRHLRAADRQNRMDDVEAGVHGVVAFAGGGRRPRRRDSRGTPMRGTVWNFWDTAPRRGRRSGGGSGARR
eukprot:1066752-Pyramimonas_sp.AAC.1